MGQEQLQHWKDLIKRGGEETHDLRHSVMALLAAG
jgi:hypothetical protein